MAENDGYAVPRTPLSDAANDVGRHLTPTDTDWLDHLVVGYLHARATADPAATAQEYMLDILTLLHGLRSKCEDLIGNSVIGSRKQGATWTDIGGRLGVSKQTAHSRYGSMIEERNGQYVIVDVVRDAVLPLTRVGPDTPPTRAQANPIPPTPQQRQVIAERLAGPEGGEPENLDLIANAIVTLARSMTDIAGGNWDDPTDSEHYLQVALATGFPALAPQQ